MADTALSEQQLARAEALDRARGVLIRREFASSGPVDAFDVYNLATFILTGESPWPQLRMTDYSAKMRAEDCDGQQS